ncbi:MAG: hypothetical protein QF712_04160 [Candidatus Marinimicrobia bacterium]|jgi:hypothetical protein|nr:hypothetical protein [Candidatus Neomarinimicrobiota bacterium]MDP6578464.1 hypothetical protein [Candidatus Neomarinimicrobiota bacterium]MDP7060902.1 hypothetical protein [Candidatus Neomarinimicrobiota bacterium]|tara:strand:- start:5702 stop:6445 length:744 start_codon:yes stop_codon:yes gene_type:complete
MWKSKFFIQFLLLFQLAISQDITDRRIAVISVGSSGMVGIEEDAITLMIEEELIAMELYNINRKASGKLSYNYKSSAGSGVGRIATNLWRSAVDTLSSESGVHVQDSDVLLWNINRSDMTYIFDFRLYRVEVDYKNIYSNLNQKINKRYLKAKNRTTLKLTGTPEDVAQATRVLTWHVVGSKLPRDRFDRGFVSDLSKDIKNSLFFFLDSGFESIFILAGFLLVGGGLYAWTAEQDLGYPPDYPEVP